jgi:hypothetical protein
MPLPAAPGIQGISDVVTACREAFEHLNVTVVDMVAEGDRVAARFTARGIHKGPFMGLPPTGKPITMTGIEIFRIGWKDRELWGEANLLGLSSWDRPGFWKSRIGYWQDDSSCENSLGMAGFA